MVVNGIVVCLLDIASTATRVRYAVAGTKDFQQELLA